MWRYWTVGMVSVVLSTIGWASPACASSKTVTLTVPGMTCSACPITVKKALQRVQGVENVTVTLEPKEAVVTFDDGKTSIAKLREATANAGYVSTAKE